MRRRMSVEAELKYSWQLAMRLDPVQLPPTPMFWLQQIMPCACTGSAAKKTAASTTLTSATFGK